MLRSGSLGEAGMKALWIFGAVVLVTVALPALGLLIRRIVRRPLTPEQQEADRLFVERRRDARYFWR
jgi:hypothetical protein